MQSERVRVGVEVRGVVQGVGYRPFVRRLASHHALAGVVGNDERGVFIEAEGERGSVERFVARLRTEAPPLATVDRVVSRALPVRGDAEFVIVKSPHGGARHALVAPDTATCDDCLHELWDPADRRFRYPFVNCTNCGPRFTIVRDVPYDRARTTMATFAMCADCAREYEDPDDRRYHAQPVCCPACGPRLVFVDRDGRAESGDALAAAVAALQSGAVVALKGLGGYHLAALASNDGAVSALRARKHREEKPFALMVPDLASARALCEIDAREEALLTEGARPIVLLDRRPDGASVARDVAPGNRALGIMLPYTPLHHVLLRDLGTAIVCTSGNVSDEPIAFDDDDARERLGNIADAFLTHDRPIHTRTDDSVVRAVAGRPLMVRRSRGYAPRPITLPINAARPILAVGAELKNTFCLVKGTNAFVSHHVGDLENFATYRAFTEGIEHYGRLFDVEPEIVAHDLHPEYLSTKYALALDGVRTVGVQHHHAHVASCLADNGETGPVIGFAFDGLGFGCDAVLWGGEVILADLAGFRRAGHLAPVPMPGGAAAIREPWRMAVAYLDRLGYEGEARDRLARQHRDRFDRVVTLARRGFQSPPTTSMGRLFDAVAVLLGGRATITYEGQAAIELEQMADPHERAAYEGDGIKDGTPFVLEGAAVVDAVLRDIEHGVDRAQIAARFHNTIAALIGAAASRVRDDEGITTVALSGGVFQNVLLLGRACDVLAHNGFRVLTHHRVPPNDGGISLGQAAVAAVTPEGDTAHP